MAEVKGKKGRSEEKQIEPRQIVLTVNAKGEIAKVEELDESGERHELSEDEFKQLADAEEHADFEAALEEAYAAGVGDAIDESVDSEFDRDEEDEIGRSILRGAAAGALFRRSVRRLILRRSLKRGAIRKRVRSGQNGAHEAPKH